MVNNENPLVSVVIPIYNSSRYIKEAIDSVLVQTYQNLEIIVVDDGSTDDTRKVLEPYAGKIEYIYKENGGPASARNVGIRESHGEYIAFLDADDTWVPEKLSLQLDLFNKNAHAGLIHSDVIRIYDSGFSEIKRKAKSTYCENKFNDLFMRNFIANSSALVRRECFDQLGYFDESRDLIANEDYDMWLRISSRYDIGYINKLLILYRVHDKGISRNPDRLYSGEEKVVKQNLERYGDSYPLIKNMYRKRLSRLFSEYGYEYFAINDFKEARKKFIISLRYSPSNLKSFKYYLLTFFSAKTVNLVKLIKKRTTLLLRDNAI